MKLDSAIFYSHDIQKVIPFYRDVLGFTLESQNERFVSFIFEDGMRLGIKNKTEEREVPGYQTIFIAVADAAAYYEELKANPQVVFYKELEQNPWGQTFSILDPDENKVLFITRPTTD